MYDAFTDLPALYDSVPLYVNRRDVQFYVDEARSAAGRVLEVGCGTGRILLPIARAGLFVDGMDASPQMLEGCEAKLRAESEEVRSRVTLRGGYARSFDLDRSPLKETSPELVVCAERITAVGT